MKTVRLLLSCLVAVAGGVPFAAADEVPALTLAVPFADRAVLQREKPIRIWGTGVPGAKVSVRLLPSEGRETTVAEDGRWQLELPAEAACRTGRVLAAETVTADGARRRIERTDVLVGEVWLATGQSNMECPLWTGDPHRREADGALFAQMTVRPHVRLLKVPRYDNLRDPKAPPYEMGAPAWRRVVPEEMPIDGSWLPSAIGTCFAVGLADELGVPVGVLDITVGGTCIGLWMPPNGVLWRNMALPFAPLQVRGQLWYQGASDVASPEGYAEKMQRLYEGWSSAFRIEGMPFYFVQNTYSMDERVFAIQLEQGKFYRAQPKSGMVTSGDRTNPADCHPSDKATIARRLLAYALARDYGYTWLRPDPPMLKGWKLDGRRLVLSFDHVQSWYQYQPDFSVESGFEICGADGVWKKASIENLCVKERKRYKSRGKIIGADLIVSSPEVERPTSLRYLHGDNWYGSLKNEMSLPLGPFQIDIAAH